LTRDPSAEDDAALADRIALGDEAAFMVAYDRHSGFLFGSTMRFLGDPDAAAETVQDAFLALWRRASQFDAASGSLLTWLLSIARHRAIDRLRADGRRPTRDAIPLDVLLGGDGSGDAGVRTDVPAVLVSDAAADPGAIAGRRWSQAVIRTGISELPEHERQVIVLGYALDLSQAQIAERLGWPIGTVKSRTRRALAHLRVRLGAVPDLADAPDRAPSRPSGRDR
jgi:RNA polymerase sigma-70 factor (ECF subfamily)